MEWSLLIVNGEDAGRRVAVDGELLIGRDVDGPGLLENDPEVSRRHARVLVAGDELSLEDLGSANGTEVNGETVAPGAPRPLAPEDVIVIGTTQLRVEGRTAPQPAPVEPQPETETLPEPTPSPISASSLSETRGHAAAPIEQRGSPSSIAPLPPMPSKAPPAELLWPGGRQAAGPGGVAIGSDPGNQIVLGAAVPWHASVNVAEGRYYVADLGNAGTVLNGEILHGESRWLNSGDRIDVAGETLRFLEGSEGGTRVASPSAIGAVAQIGSVLLSGDTLSFGRDPSNDVVLDDPNVSRFHAEVRRLSDGGAQLRDLRSRNGTRLNSGFIARPAPVRPGDEIGIGPFRLVFDGAGFVQRDDRGALRLRADRITTTVKGKTILNAASIQIEPGEFVVVIGESGSGKSTMIKALAGIYEPTQGAIAVNGEPVLSRLTDIGYVPQSEIVHPNLTVLEALSYAAALRLPRDSTQQDIDEAVSRVLEQLSLNEHADTRIGSLSGGQRKRAGVGVELLNRPSLLFLDEPTTGLDPGLETRMMELFRELAEAGKRSVTVVTHATKNLDLADKVCVMGRGGEPAFIGTPQEAKRFFGVDTYDGIYTALIDRPATEWRADFEARRESDGAGPPPPPQRAAPKPRASVLRQTLLLAKRYAVLVARDRRNLAILLGQAPVLALLIAFMFDANVFQTGATGDPGTGALLLFLVITSAIWLGAIDGAREVIKERPLMERERAVGVQGTAYLASKGIVLFSLVTIQVTALFVIVFGLRTLHQSFDHYFSLYLIMLFTGFAAVGTGLLLSAYVRSEDQAGSFLPLALIPQLLFGGAIVATREMGPIIEGLSNVVFSRWSFAGSGEAIEFNQRIADVQASGALVFDKYGPDFFTINTLPTLLILGAFVAVFFGATWATLTYQRSRGL